MFGDDCLPWILIYLDESFIRALNQSVTGIVLQLWYCYMVFMISFSLVGSQKTNTGDPCLLTSYSVMIQFRCCWIKFMISLWSCSCCNVPVITWLWFSHLTTSIHLWQLQHSAVTWLPFSTFTASFHQENQWKSLQEATSHGHVTSCLTNIGDELMTSAGIAIACNFPLYDRIA